MLDFVQAIEQLKRDWVEFKSSSNNIIRKQIEIAPIDLLSWLSVQESKTKIYWQDRDKGFRVAAIGEAASYDEIPNELMTEARFWGGVAFQPHDPQKSQWIHFGMKKFVLPCIEIVAQGQRYFIIIQCLNSVFSKTKAHQTLHSIKTHLPMLEKNLPLPENRLDTPSQLLWERHVIDILNHIHNDRVQKVVLARQVQLEFKEPVSPFFILANLAHLAINSTCFLFHWNGDTFLGASPERLFRRIDRTLETEAIAGTRPEGGSKSEDEQFRMDLKMAEKDLAEHQFVVEMIKNSLPSICERFSQDPQAEILDIQGGHHLLTRFKGQLKNGITDEEILTILHPTPAVAGSPTAEALEYIQQYENFSRGWYAAPIGYISSTACEFVVGIRSALLHQNVLTIFAGAGIVKDSVPSLEWQETENKMINFLKIFNANL